MAFVTGACASGRLRGSAAAREPSCSSASSRFLARNSIGGADTARRRRTHARWTAKWVRVSVPIEVEGPRDFVYETFSDFEQFSNWSGTLEGVERDPDDIAFSDWRFAWQGVRLSWRSKDRQITPPEFISWETVSGLTHRGEVLFEDLSDEANARKGGSTRLTMTIDYDVNSIIAVVMQSKFVNDFVKSAMLKDLASFRSYALRQLRAQRAATM